MKMMPASPSFNSMSSNENVAIVPSPLVFFVSDHLKMIRIDTHAIAAQVVDLFLAGNVAMDMSIHDTMDSYSLSVEAHARITSTSSVTGM